MSSLSFVLTVLLLVFQSTPALSIQPGGEQPFVTAHPSSNRSSNINASPRSISAVSGTLSFTLVTAEAPWSARSIGAVELFTRPLSYVSSVTRQPVTIPSNAFVLHGGSGAFNDVRHITTVFTLDVILG